MRRLERLLAIALTADEAEVLVLAARGHGATVCTSLREPLARAAALTQATSSVAELRPAAFAR
jgi:hypothetical protein